MHSRGEDEGESLEGIGRRRGRREGVEKNRGIYIYLEGLKGRKSSRGG